MPLTDKGEKIKSAMQEQYGDKKGEQVFHASKNKGTIEGVDATEAERQFSDIVSRVHKLDADSKRLEADCDDEVKADGNVEGVAVPEKGATTPVTVPPSEIA